MKDFSGIYLYQIDDVIIVLIVLCNSVNITQGMKISALKMGLRSLKKLIKKEDERFIGNSDSSASRLPCL